MSTWVHVAELKDLARRRKKQVVVDGRPVALFLVDGEVHALHDVCIHKQRSLSKGTVMDGRVICPGHQWKFDPRTGQPDDQPGCQPVFPVQVTEDGHILLDPSPRASTPASSAASADDPR